MNLPDLLTIPPSLPPELVAARAELERNPSFELLEARVAELERKEIQPK